MPATKTLKLPAPDPRYAFYQLADGSRIYPSGVQYDDRTRACKWFVWRCRGSHEVEEWDERGKRRSISLVKDGEILCDREGVMLYFASPQEALQTLNKETT
jgi:hypothetical protein